MILTTHILSGAVLGANVKNPYAVAGLAVAVHFALDLLPHGDYLNKKSKLKEFWKVGIDLAIGFFILTSIFFVRGFAPTENLNINNIIIGIFFSLLPDGTTFLYWKMGVKFLKPIYDFHQKIHHVQFPDNAPEREFRLKNNLWDILISFVSIVALILI